jgi:hypothetical protein
MWLALGHGGYDPATRFIRLTATQGPFEVQIPAGVQVEAYDEAWIWSEEYDEPVAMAQLDLTEPIVEEIEANPFRVPLRRELQDGVREGPDAQG